MSVIYFWVYWFMNMFIKIWSSLEGGQGYCRGFISVDKNAGDPGQKCTYPAKLSSETCKPQDYLAGIL